MGKMHMGRGDMAVRDRVMPTHIPIEIAPMPVLIEPIQEIKQETTQLVYVDREVMVPQITEVIKEVVVEKLVEVPVEKLVEVIVEKIVEVPVIKYIDRDVERIVIKEVVHIEHTLALRTEVRSLKKNLIRTQVALVLAAVLATIGFMR